MIEGRWIHTATLLTDGRVLVVGGRSNNCTSNCPIFSLDSAEIFDPATGTFTQTGFLNYSRYNHTATLLSDGRVLILGRNDRGPWDRQRPSGMGGGLRSGYRPLHHLDEPGACTQQSCGYVVEQRKTVGYCGIQIEWVGDGMYRVFLSWDGRICRRPGVERLSRSAYGNEIGEWGSSDLLGIKFERTHQCGRNS